MPIQYLVDGPVRFVDWVETSLTSRASLLAENDELKAEQLLLRAQIQKLENAQQENAQLQQLLKSSDQLPSKFLVARLLAVDTDPASQQMILSRGSHRGVYVGQPVLDANGIMGQVIEVSLYTSRVLLITDTHSAIPIEDTRTAYRAIAVGNGNLHTLRLVNVAPTADFKVGDLLVSSGLDGHYPVGYPVGIVSAVTHNNDQPFATITIEPTGHLQQSRLVLLIWPHDQNKALTFGPLPSSEGTPTHRLQKIKGKRHE